MELNLEKLKNKLNNIDNGVIFSLEKEYNNKTKEYYTVIEFNNLIFMTLSDTVKIKNDIENFYLYGIQLRIKDFDTIRKTLDFIEANEQAIKTAIIESIE